jgi:predicted transglutaminase-like cysteine proteinase
MKTLSNTSVNQAKDNVSDLETYGDTNLWQILCKASSKKEGWMKSTKVMNLVEKGNPVGCLVQVTTQQGDNIAEAITFVPCFYIEHPEGKPPYLEIRSKEQS